MTMEQWRVGEITVRGSKGSFPVAGWINGPFGIDFRVEADEDGFTSKCWAITHLATGYSARCFEGSRKEVCSLVEKMTAAADWDFTDPAEAATRGPALKPVFTDYGMDRQCSDAVGPLFEDDATGAA